MIRTPQDTPTSIYQSVIYNMLQRPRADPELGVALAVTSPNPREGVTQTAYGLARALTDMSTQRIILLDLHCLHQEWASLAALARNARQDNDRLVWMRSRTSNGSNGAKGKNQLLGSFVYPKECIRRLCVDFELVLIDCPSLRTSPGVLNIAPTVDGVILVVAADATTKEDVIEAERQILLAGGKLEGHILNKRRYDVPDWIYRRL
jgi:protein-tyrosine kinase